MIERNRIYHGDYLELMAQIDDRSIDLVVTDPPYLHDKSPTKATTDDSEWNYRSKFAKSDLYRYGGKMMNGMSSFGEKEIGDFLALTERKMKIMNAYMFCSEEQVPYYSAWAKNHGYNFTILVWEKPLSIINKNRFSQNLEYIVRVYDYGTALNRLDNNAYYSRVKREHPVLGKDKRHPTEKPVELVQEFIELSSVEGDLVLDPFIGSGTTAVAAIRTRRNFIGFEINEEFFKTADRRVRAQMMEQTLF